MKELKNLTINEYYDYKDILDSDSLSEDEKVFECFNIFGVDKPEELSISEYREGCNIMFNVIIDTTHTPNKIKRGKYTIKFNLNPLTYTAGQFIDFQNFNSDPKQLHYLLTIFSTFYERNKFGCLVKSDINNNIVDKANFILYNLTIGEAQSISFFFTHLSTKLLKTFQIFSAKKVNKMKKEKLKQLKIKYNK